MRRMNVVNRKQALKVVKELDAFPKVPDNYVETTVSGGGISIIVFLFIAILVVSEIFYYTNTELKFNYEVDRDHSTKLNINIDMTVAMPCNLIGADVLDLTGQSTENFGHLKEEPAYFQLTQSQLNYHNMIHQINDYIKNEYHAIHHFLWKTGYNGMATAMPPRDPNDDQPVGPPDGCRVHGQLTVNKVAGNFHITAGKSVPVFPRGHAHLAMNVGSKEYNFSHRIDHFSFGEVTPGVVNPLDGDLKVIAEHYHMYQYFIQVVPTKVETQQANVDTYQYAVTEKNRTINHGKGSHGVPGIFVKYDLSSLKVKVSEEHKPYWQFLVRLCGIIGGIFATSGMLHSLIGFLMDVICCRYKIGGYQKTESPEKTLSESFPRQETPTVPLTTYNDEAYASNTAASPGFTLNQQNSIDSTSGISLAPPGDSTELLQNNHSDH